MSILLDLRTAIPLASGLTLYFYFHPVFPLGISIVFWGLFVFFYFLDARITVRNSDLMSHEKNIVFPLLYKKLGCRISPVIQCGLEIAVMALNTFFFTTKIEFSDVSVTAFVFGLSHLLGYLSNKKLVDSLTHR